MSITIIAFGQIAEITGKELVVNAVDTTQLQQLLLEKFPALAEKKYAIAVNKSLAVNNVVLKDNDTVALMPPYSGG